MMSPMSSEARDFKIRSKKKGLWILFCSYILWLIFSSDAIVYFPPEDAPDLAHRLMLSIRFSSMIFLAS